MSTIKLGEREFAFRPLKLGEYRAVFKALAIEDPVDRSMGLLAAGLPEANLTPEIIAEIEAPWYELTEAADRLLDLARLKRAETNPTGEAAPQPAAAD